MYAHALYVRVGSKVEDGHVESSLKHEISKSKFDKTRSYGSRV